MSKFVSKFLFALAIVLVAGISLAAGPAWMPGFPMRMGTNVMLMWAPVPGATGYNLYRSEKSGDIGKMLISVPANNHMDMNVPMDKDAVYTVKAVVGGAEGDAGAQGIIAGVKPLDPPKFSGDLYQNDQLSVRWDRVNGAAFYNVYKSETKEGPFNLAGSIQEVTYVDASVTPGKTYYYQVSGVDKNNVESPRSEIKEVAIKKAAVVAKKAAFEHAEKLMKLDNHAYGGPNGPYRGPGFMAYNPVDKRIYVTADSGLFSIDAAGNLMARMEPPADYPGEWGTIGYVAIDGENGNIWTTWRLGMSMVKVFNTAGALVGEANLDFPKEDYIAEKREADMKEDEKLVPQAQGIAVDGEGEVWVYDATFHQIVVYDNKFDRVARFPSPMMRDSKNPAFIPNINSMVYLPKTNRVVGIDGITNKAYIFDAATNGYVKKDGEDVYAFDKGGTGPGYTMIAKGIAALEDGNIVMVAGDAATLQVLDPSKDFAFLYFLQTEPGKENARSQEIGAPAGVTVVGKKVYVSDKIGDEIGIFTIQ